MSSKRVFKSKLQRQAQTRPLDNASDSESLSQYSLNSTPSNQTPRITTETVVHEVEVRGSPDAELPLQEVPHHSDIKSERFYLIYKLINGKCF